ncbi:type 4b pilus protein PilO2 [Facilibium subflavum]|uniref:type 4b pilus protein PilO2 n=1 Tax=Facilibium subflavum TaxID=2219058 RepID=UPI000E64D0BC|nr:type 4b pilus protein PilO2 [Facilibium subflavum]
MFEKYIAGLIWQNLDRPGRVSRAEAQKRPYVMALNKLQYGFSEKTEDKNKISLSALFAHKYDNVIFITDKLEKENQSSKKQYWLCVIEDSQIVNFGTLLAQRAGANDQLSSTNKADNEYDINYSGDQLLTQKALLALAPHLCNKVQSNQKSFTVNIDTDSQEIRDAFKNKLEVQNNTLTDEIKSLAQYNKKARLTTYHARRMRKLIIGVAVGAVVLAGYHYLTQPPPKKHINYALIKAKLEKQHQQQAKKDHQAFIQWEKKHEAYFLMQKVQCMLHQLPLLESGWLLDNYHYMDSHSIQALQLSYHRLFYGKLSDIIKATIPGFTILRHDVEKHADNVQLVVSPDIGTCSVINANIGHGAKHSVIDLVSGLQLIGLDYQSSKQLSNASHNTRFYTIEVSGSGLGQLKSYIYLTEGYSNLILYSFSVSLQSGQLGKWNVTTKLYI